MGRSVIKGSVRITLHNPKTGKNEVVEGRNIITNAVKDIFANNYMGGLDYSKSTPLWSNWFGGVLAYKNAHPTITVGGEQVLDPDDYFPQDSVTNPVTAHAGNVAPASSAIVAEDYSRGSPSTQIIQDGYVKQTWEWTPSQGNGTIAALSLTHKDTGNVGLGNTGSAFQAFSPFLIVSGGQLSSVTVSLNGAMNVFTKYDENHGLAFYIGGDGDYKSGYTKFQTSDVSVQIKLLGYDKFRLFETTSAVDTNIRKFTVTTSITFYNEPAYYFDETNKRLWLFTNYTSTYTYTAGSIYYTVIDCENETEYDHGTISMDTANLAPIACDRTGGNSYNEPNFYNIVKNGDYFYFYITTTSPNDWNMNNLESNPYTGFKKIKVSQFADQTDITLSSPVYRARGGMAGGGLTLHDGCVLNGDVGYKCSYIFPWATNANSELMNTPNNVSSFLMPMGNGATGQPRYILANKMVNTTKFNLPSAVTKTASQSMIIEYSLQEVTGNE